MRLVVILRPPEKKPPAWASAAQKRVERPPIKVSKGLVSRNSVSIAMPKELGRAADPRRRC